MNRKENEKKRKLQIRSSLLLRLSAGVLAAVMLATITAGTGISSSRNRTDSAAAEKLNSLDSNRSVQVTAPWEQQKAEDTGGEQTDSSNQFSACLQEANSAVSDKDYTKALTLARECEELAADPSQKAAAMVLKGNIYFYQQEYSTAQQIYDLVLQIKQDTFTTAELYCMLARCSLLLNDPQSAVKNCSTGIKSLAPGDETAADLYVLRGTAYLYSGSYSLATKDFKSAIQMGYKDDETLYEQISLCEYLAGNYAESISAGQKTKDGQSDWIGLSYYAAGDYEKAAEAYEELLNTDQSYYTKAQIESCIAKCRILIGQYDEAISRCNAGLKTGEKSEAPTLYSLRGTAYMAKGENLLAAKDFDAAVSSGYRDAAALNTQASACYYFGEQYDDAIRCGEAAIESAGKDTEAVLWVGLAYYMEQDYKDAALWLERTLKVQQSYCTADELNRILTRCYLLTGQYGDASDAATRGLAAIDPEQPTGTTSAGEMYALRGAAYMSLEEYEKALSDFSSALAAGYSSVYEILKQSTLCDFLLGNYEDAVTNGSQALEHGDGTGDLYYWMGLSYFSLEKYEEAKKTLLLAQKLDDQQENLYFYLGVSCFSLEQYQEAADDFTTSADRGETKERSLYNRGLCMLQLKEYDQAKADLQEAASQETDASVAADAQKLLDSLQAALS